MSDIEDWVSPDILNVNAYHVPSAEGLIKLDAMENPYSLPDNLRNQWLEQLSGVAINRYPDPGCNALKQRIRNVMEVPDQSDILLGNGSDELIQMIAMLVGGQGRSLAAPAPSFSMYQLISTLTGTEFVSLPLREDFSADADLFVDTIKRNQPACVFLAYPNNPTGNSFEVALIERVIESAPGLVIVDEAYHSFSGKSFLQRLPEHRNLLVMRTLSKSGLAGLRLGMLMGHPDWLEQLDKIRLPYNINSLTQSSALFCLDHYDILAQQTAQILQDRQQMFATLIKRDSITAYPSDTNFILIRLDGAFSATTVHQQLKNLGVLVKNLHQPASALENCLRITVGTPAENAQFLEALAIAMS